MQELPGDDGVWDLRDYDPAAIIALNNRDSEKTSLLDEGSFDRLVNAAAFARGIGDGPDGFVIAMTEASPYDNPNFAWFKARHPRFVYVDRIVVAEAARGRGIARRLYAALFDFATANGKSIAGCEVNIDPPNPVSDAFHAALGFSEAGQALLANGKTVRYLTKALR